MKRQGATVFVCAACQGFSTFDGPRSGVTILVGIEPVAELCDPCATKVEAEWKSMAMRARERLREAVERAVPKEVTT